MRVYDSSVVVTVKRMLVDALITDETVPLKKSVNVASSELVSVLEDVEKSVELGISVRTTAPAVVLDVSEFDMEVERSLDGGVASKKGLDAEKLPEKVEYNKLLVVVTVPTSLLGGVSMSNKLVVTCGTSVVAVAVPIASDVESSKAVVNALVVSAGRATEVDPAEVEELLVLDSSGPSMVVVISRVLVKRVIVSTEVLEELVTAEGNGVIAMESVLVGSTVESLVLGVTAVPIADEVSSACKQVPDT